MAGAAHHHSGHRPDSGRYAGLHHGGHRAPVRRHQAQSAAQHPQGVPGQGAELPDGGHRPLQPERGQSGRRLHQRRGRQRRQHRHDPLRPFQQRDGRDENAADPPRHHRLYRPCPVQQLPHQQHRQDPGGGSQHHEHPRPLRAGQQNVPAAHRRIYDHPSGNAGGAGGPVRRHRDEHSL